MPLTMAKAGEEICIKKVTGKDETRRFLANLGFTPGQPVAVVSQQAGNMICNVKGSRVALDKTMASRIII